VYRIQNVQIQLDLDPDLDLEHYYQIMGGIQSLELGLFMSYQHNV